MITPKKFSAGVKKLPMNRDSVKEIDELVQQYSDLLVEARAAGALRLPGNGKARMRDTLEKVAKNGPNANVAVAVAIELYKSAATALAVCTKRAQIEANANAELQRLHDVGTKAQTTGEALTVVLRALEKGNVSLVDRLRALIDMHKADNEAGQAPSAKKPSTEWGTFRTKRNGIVKANAVTVLQSRGELFPAYSSLLNGVLHSTMAKEGKKNG